MRCGLAVTRGVESRDDVGDVGDFWLDKFTERAELDVDVAT